MNKLLKEFEEFSCTKNSLKSVIGGDISTTETQTVTDCDGVEHTRTRGDNIETDIETGLKYSFDEWSDWSGICPADPIDNLLNDFAVAMYPEGDFSNVVPN